RPRPLPLLLAGRGRAVRDAMSGPEAVTGEQSVIGGQSVTGGQTMTAEQTVTGRTLVAGVGNVFQRDDAFGVEVVRLLAERPETPGVQIRDFGIRGVHLAYDLLDGCDLFVLV